MAIVYYGSRLSDNIIKLENGCIVCKNVPIARIGTYVYTKDEIGIDVQDSVVEVFREQSEVFSPKTIASFNGVAFTDTHPPVDVTSDNWSMYSKGEVTNVHRGEGKDTDFLMADIIVRDPITINEIESGAKREISAGYECEYVERDGKIFQKNIVGNHVALVQQGRAGHNVKIRDKKEIAIKKTKRYDYIKTIQNSIRNLEIMR